MGAVHLQRKVTIALFVCPLALFIHSGIYSIFNAKGVSSAHAHSRPNLRQHHPKSAAPGPDKAQALAQALQVSQPTVPEPSARWVTRCLRRRKIYSIHPSRSTPHPSAGHRVPRHRPGQLETLGTLVPVCPEGFVMIGGSRLHSDGLPWWIYDMRPQGYLGRAYCQRHGQPGPARSGWATGATPTRYGPSSGGRYARATCSSARC